MMARPSGLGSKRLILCGFPESRMWRFFISPDPFTFQKFPVFLKPLIAFYILKKLLIEED